MQVLPKSVINIADMNNNIEKRDQPNIIELFNKCRAWINAYLHNDIKILTFLYMYYKSQRRRQNFSSMKRGNIQQKMTQYLLKKVLNLYKI